MSRPSLFPAPEFALKAVLGEGAVLVLEGQRVVPSAATDLKFKFTYGDIYDALREIVRA
jgi:NAD dependent epimerase/dehydratase family enzyme